MPFAQIPITILDGDNFSREDQHPNPGKFEALPRLRPKHNIYLRVVPCVFKPLARSAC